MAENWREPKTNWVDGDNFNLDDWNRISINLQDLFTDFEEVYTLSVDYIHPTKGYGDNLAYDDVSTFNNALYVLCTETNNGDWIKWGTADHLKMYNAEELNEIEAKSFLLHNKITNQLNGRRMLQFNLGSREEF